MNDPQAYYLQQEQVYTVTLKKLHHRKSVFGWLRFISILFVPICGFFLWDVNSILACALALFFLVLFTRILLLDLKNKTTIAHTERLLVLCKNEIMGFQTKYPAHKTAIKLEGLTEHPYAADLDILGPASLFEFINRTPSEMGSKQLAQWLLYPSNSNEILARQSALKELSTKPEFQLNFQATGLEYPIKEKTQHRILEWVSMPAIFQHKIWLYLRVLIPVLMITIFALNSMGYIQDPVRNIVLLLSGLLAFFITRKVEPVHQQLSKLTDELETLQQSVLLIEAQTFQSPLLCQLQEALLDNKIPASQHIKSLKQQLDRFDMRLNVVVFIPLALFFQWDLQQILLMEKWKKKHGAQIQHWLTVLAKFEALNSLAVMTFNHPDWCFPEIREQYFSIEGQAVAHPLIPQNRSVSNPIQIKSREEVVLITGSNMAGKSTYLRCIGVNVVLAMCGAPVCAKAFQLSPVQLMSSMRIADNLEESTSTFYAELKKLKSIIDAVNKGDQVLVLLDEMLRGTNSLDRFSGSQALIKQLIQKAIPAYIATHDLQLTELKQQYPHNIETAYFDVQVKGEELYFDYKLKSGICSSMNASILMKKIGIEYL
ncbi:MAG: MutS-related protein [Ferruginibacter sp.]